MDGLQRKRKKCNALDGFFDQSKPSQRRYLTETLTNSMNSFHFRNLLLFIFIKSYFLVALKRIK